MKKLALELKKEEDDKKEWFSWSVFDLEDHKNEITETTKPTSFLIDLLEYQKEWLTWAVNLENSEKKGGILADEKGMGKIIQAIALVVYQRELRTNEESTPTTIVICDEDPMANGVNKWKSELERCSSTKITVYNGEQSEMDRLRSYDFVITTYSTIETEYKKWKHRLDQQQPFLHQVKLDRIILDEVRINHKFFE